MRQRVQRQCCTRGRPRPAHPRQLAKVCMRDVPARRFVRARCRAPVLVCSHCDRELVYCAEGCSATARRQAQRDAGRRYQDSLPGHFHHAARATRTYAGRYRPPARLREASGQIAPSLPCRSSPPRSSCTQWSGAGPVSSRCLARTLTHQRHFGGSTHPGRVSGVPERRSPCARQTGRTGPIELAAGHQYHPAAQCQRFGALAGRCGPGAAGQEDARCSNSCRWR